jgi:zinc transporter 5/7
MAFMFVELLYGYMSNSLGLISDAFHMLFDCMALFIGLSASYISQLKNSDNEYTYGYTKIETISGLFNGIFLVFISYNILCESVERIYEPIKIKDDGLITVAVLGLIVNMIGLVFFHDFHHHGEECSHGHSHKAVETEEHSHCDHEHGEHEHGEHEHEHQHEEQ